MYYTYNIYIYCDGYCIFAPRLHYPGKTGRISVDSIRTTQALNILRN